MRGVVFVAMLLGCQLLTGCDGDNESGAPNTPISAAATTQPEAGPGTFVYETDGVRVTLDVPTPSDDARVAELETFRQQVGADPLFYIAVEVDNSNGTEDVWTNTAQVVTEDKRQVEVAAFSEVNGGVEAADTWPGGYTDERVRLSNTYGGVVVKPGAVATTVLATYEDISSPTRVFVPVEDYGETLPTVRLGSPRTAESPPAAPETTVSAGEDETSPTVQQVADKVGCRLQGEAQATFESEYECGEFYIVDFDNTDETEQSIVNTQAFAYVDAGYGENFAYLGNRILVLGPLQAVEDLIPQFPGAR